MVALALLSLLFFTSVAFALAALVHLFQRAALVLKVRNSLILLRQVSTRVTQSSVRILRRKKFILLVMRLPLTKTYPSRFFVTTLILAKVLHHTLTRNLRI